MPWTRSWPGRPSGTSQATIAGHQLYYFSGDSAPGQAYGQGQRSTFLLVNSQGQTVQ
jgi:predicted lipoprotein with Yx(FWY)xxD motif